MPEQSDQLDNEDVSKDVILENLRETAVAQAGSIAKLVTIVDTQNNTFTDLSEAMRDQRKFITRFVSFITAITLVVVSWLAWFVYDTVSSQTNGMEQFIKVLIDVNAYSVQCNKENAPDIRVCMYDKLAADQGNQPGR